MSVDAAIRIKRLSVMHEKFLDAAACPLFHIAFPVDDVNTIDILKWWPGGYRDHNYHDYEKRKAVKPSLAKLQKDVLRVTGISGDKKSTGPLRFLNKDWRGQFISGDSIDVFSGNIAEFVELAKMMKIDDAVEGTWIEFLYAILGKHQMASNSLALAWIPHNVFLASVRAIEMMIAGSPYVETNTPTNPNLSEAEKRIIEVIQTAGHRLKTNEIVCELEKQHGAASEGTTKMSLAGLVRLGLLTNRQDVFPKGYGLPEWNDR